MAEPDEFAEFAEFAERTVADHVEPVPSTVIWRLLRDADRRDRDGRAAIRAERAARTVLATEVALALHELRRFVAVTGSGSGPGDPDFLAALTDRFGQALARGGARVEDPTGRPWPDVREWADPLPGGPSVGADELVVAATLVPGVWVDDELVRRATVEVDRAPGNDTTGEPA